MTLPDFVVKAEDMCPHCKQLPRHEYVKECIKALGIAVAELQARLSETSGTR